MKKVLLIASCLLTTGMCVGCEKPEVKKKYVKVTGLYAMPEEFCDINKSIAHGLYTINDINSGFSPVDCPVPSPKKKSPETKDMEYFELVDSCPVSPVQPRK